MSWFSGLIETGVDKVVDSVGNTIDKIFTSDDERLKAKNLLEQVRNELKTTLIKAMSEVIQAKKDVIITEMGGSSLQRNWRPMLMLLFGFIIANEYIISPYIQVLFDTTLPVKPITEDMWAVLKLGIGGYISGRSIEKAVQLWKQNEK
jgi:hypothetical protein